MGTPHVSVVIPAHNRATLLCMALESAADQTYRDFEIIVVDDGSTQDLRGAVAAMRASPRLSGTAASTLSAIDGVRWVRQGQSGAAAARNRGVAESRGEWIAFLDSDDVWLPKKLERYVAAADANEGTPIWYGPMDPIDDADRPLAGRSKPCHGGRITRELFESTFVHVPTVMCRRSLFEAHGGFDESLRVCEDLDLWLRISAQHAFGLIPEPLALRRVHDDRLSKSLLHENLAIKLRVMERFYLAHGGDGLLDDAAARERLGNVAYSAARELQRAGLHARACEHYAAARRYGKSLWRCGPRHAIAALLRGKRA